MTDQWAYCVGCRRWFFCEPRAAQADDAFGCPVCLRPSRHTRLGAPGSGAEPEDLIADSSEG